MRYQARAEVRRGSSHRRPRRLEGKNSCVTQLAIVFPQCRVLYMETRDPRRGSPSPYEEAIVTDTKSRKSPPPPAGSTCRPDPARRRAVGV